MRACEVIDSVITVVNLKVGATTSTLQLQLSQKDKIKVVALVTSTNFDKPVGPTIATGWRLRNPDPAPVPDFDKVRAQKPDEHWIPAYLTSEVVPFSRRILSLKPRLGSPVGVNDAWNSFVGEEWIRNTYLPLMADSFPSMSDTLLRNGGLYDANRTFDQIK